MRPGNRCLPRTLKHHNSNFLYGLNPAFEALRANRRPIHRAYMADSKTRNPRLKKLRVLLDQKKIPIESAERGLLQQLCNQREHQSIVLETGPYPYVPLEKLLTQNNLILLDNIEDPQNVGAILRSAEAFGYSGILLPTKGVPPVLPSVVKASSGASEHLQICYTSTANRYLISAQKLGFHTIALDAKGDIDLNHLSVPLDSKILLVIGGENRSVGRYILASADQVVRIPQAGHINSLNASASAAIAMYRIANLQARL
ncbi:MAG: Putative TrmH family tRNA/rRNA methyltransferase [Candidatus Moanabacter tarae]|uniref:TrmH family tRNA/rRNA methyltransferase n=1 Tax=Candidatus Moanibacter tarae TaxID=2200854 RepID=A0A2Z4AF28_9BACT|nr:MAG: Putative TrmH family tRNA/rRNA methyltransferase [Candidatus Moanabacter tarae]|tara:strand:- start:31751 stop:32524 length:774 start_codon:yes stop_codon:yes gene_type:complete